MKTRSEIIAALESVSALIKPLCTALEVANRADSSTRHDNPAETGMLPTWAGAAFNPIFAVLCAILDDKFGVNLQHDVQVNWGGCGSFFEDIREAIISALVPLLRDVASETRNTSTGKIAKLDGIWYSVNADSTEREFEIRYALPSAERVKFSVEND